MALKLTNRHIVKLTILFIILSATLKVHPDERQIQAALRAMYTYDFEKAQALFKGQCLPGNLHPLAPLGALATSWLGDQEQVGFGLANERLFSRIDTTVRIYRDYLQTNGEMAEIYFYLGATLGLKARVALGRKDWLAVLFNGYSAVNYVRKAARLAPTYSELQLPLGVFNYYVGVSRGYMRVASFILQTSGDKEDGLRQIQAAAEDAPYGKYEARGILAFIYLYLEDKPELAYQEARRLSQEFPPNPYYHFLMAEALLALGEIKAAEKEIRVLKTLVPQLKAFTKAEYQLRLHLLEGEVAFAREEWSKAEQELRYYVEHYDLESDLPLTIALVKLGQIADLQGQRPKALQYYRKAVGLDNRTIACRQAAYYLKNPYCH